MRKEINKFDALAICGRIRYKRDRVALMATDVGIKIKPVEDTNLLDLGRYELIGVYDHRVTADNILEDWNETI